jgi:hypothetical protein
MPDGFGPKGRKGGNIANGWQTIQRAEPVGAVLPDFGTAPTQTDCDLMTVQWIYLRKRCLGFWLMPTAAGNLAPFFRILIRCARFSHVYTSLASLSAGCSLHQSNIRFLSLFAPTAWTGFSRPRNVGRLPCADSPCDRAAMSCQTLVLLFVLLRGERGVASLRHYARLRGILKKSWWPPSIGLTRRWRSSA